MAKKTAAPSKIPTKSTSNSLPAIPFARDVKQTELWNKTPYDATVSPNNRGEFVTTCSLKLLDDCFRWMAFAILVDDRDQTIRFRATQSLWRILATLEHRSECFDRHCREIIVPADEPIVHGNFVANSWTEIPRSIAQSVIGQMRIWEGTKAVPVWSIRDLADSIFKVNCDLLRVWIEREEQQRGGTDRPLAKQKKRDERKYDLQKDLSIVEMWERNDEYYCRDKNRQIMAVARHGFVGRQWPTVARDADSSRTRPNYHQM